MLERSGECTNTNLGKCGVICGRLSIFSDEGKLNKTIHEFVGMKHLCKRIYKLTVIKSVCGNPSRDGKSIISCVDAPYKNICSERS